MLRRALIAATALALLPAVLPAAGHAAPEPGFAALRTPYVDVADRVLRFGAGSVPFGDGVDSVAQSARAAYVDDGARLTVVPADGSAPRVLDRGLVGLPLADPLGGVAVWTARTDQGVRLRSYDDRTGAVSDGPLVGRSRVFAVDGRTALVVPKHRPGPSLWRLGGTLRPLRGSHGFVSDLHDGRRLELREGLVLVDRRGRVLDRLGDFFSGTFSPDGRTVALAGARVVHDVESGTARRLRGLGREEVVSSRWTPAGDLVVHVGDLSDYDDANAMRRLVCRMPQARCTALPGAARLFHDPAFESTAVGVLMATTDLG